MKSPKQKDFLIKESTKHFNFTSFGNESFSSLRQEAGINDEDYTKSICENNMKVIITPGKSGALLFFTSDKKYVLKTVSVTERKFLIKILKNYETHVKQHPSTTIVRLLALYKITINKASIQLLVMENVFPIKPKVVYDLKGSSIGRSATIEEKQSGGILKDNDLTESETTIQTSTTFKQEFIDMLVEDCKFLSNNEIMDYSMLLGMCPYSQEELFEQSPKSKFTHFLSFDQKQQYYLGIIDILQKWNLKKKAEVQYKQTLLQNDKTKLSAMPPKDYANRFVSFLCDCAISAIPEEII
jgi:1-phosphatidylinositol-4-phosphate 5-kinase